MNDLQYARVDSFGGRSPCVVCGADACDSEIFGCRAWAKTTRVETRRVLDIGAGAGNMAHHLAHYGQVIGLDYVARPLAVAHARALDVCQGAGDGLPFAKESFDLVALLDTVEHIPDEFGVFAECRRVLKPGGKVIITVPAFMWLWSYNDEINAHQRRYTAPELRQKLEISGLRVTRLSYNNFFLFPLIAGLRLLRPEKPELASPHLSKMRMFTKWRWSRSPNQPTAFCMAWAGWRQNCCNGWSCPLASV